MGWAPGGLAVGLGQSLHQRARPIGPLVPAASGAPLSRRFRGGWVEALEHQEGGGFRGGFGERGWLPRRKGFGSRGGIELTTPLNGNGKGSAPDGAPSLEPVAPEEKGGLWKAVPDGYDDRKDAQTNDRRAASVATVNQLAQDKVAGRLQRSRPRPRFEIFPEGGIAEMTTGRTHTREIHTTSRAQTTILAITLPVSRTFGYTSALLNCYRSFETVGILILPTQV